jgi:hypothetical protein
MNTSRTQRSEKSGFNCHRNGEPVMKELSQPWQNWHSQNGTIKPESIPDDSPLKTDPLFMIEPPSAFLRDAGELEKIVEQWIGNLNRSRLARYKSGVLSVRVILEPLFRTATINFKPSIDSSVGVGGKIRIPWTFFFNVRGILDLINESGLACDAFGAFGPATPSLDRTSYINTLSALNFRLEDPGVYLKRPGDTHFAFLTPEPPRSDTDLIFNLVNEGIIGRRLAVTLLLVDMPNAVYSPIRQALFQLVPDWKFSDVGPQGLDAQLADVFRALHTAGAQPALVREGLSQFLTLWSGPQSTWEADACARLEGYLENVGKRWRTGDYVPYFKLLGARREGFFSSDHMMLKESELLFPKSSTDPALIMRYDGSVGPR